IQTKVRDWCQSLSGKYASITCEKSTLPASQIKNSFLRESTESDLLFITSSDVFLKPFTLRFLAQKNLPIIAPLLRPAPKHSDVYRNFFLSADESGYYKEHLDYYDIMERKKIGTFKADCVHAAYLIQNKYVDELSFGEPSSPWDFIAFSNVARANQISQFICNEREFGFFNFGVLQKDILIPCVTKNIDREDVREIASRLNPDVNSDANLKKYLEQFPVDTYSLFQVNEDLYWVDEKWDWVKSHYIKKGIKWEPQIEELFSKYVKAGDTVLDLGGHIGTHALSLSRIVGNKGAVHVFEPQAKLFTELTVNVALNNCENVHPHRVALGEYEKIAHIFHPCSTNEGMAMIGENGEAISMKKLDDFNIQNVSFIKIDIEGYEIEALKGGIKTILKNKPVMIVEVLPNAECEQRLDFIRNLGYELSPLEDYNYLCIPKEKVLVREKIEDVIIL
nr:FkbM family methyltransferase [Parachlamydiaceae bacterium]